jgi:hypothetical protein
MSYQLRIACPISLSYQLHGLSASRIACPVLSALEGHRNEQGGFDADMSELQKQFVIGFLSQFLSEIHCPMIDVTSAKPQVNDIPERLHIRDPAGGPN